MQTINRVIRLFMFLLAAASSPPTAATETDLVVWDFGSGTSLFYPETFDPLGVVTGNFTYALGGGLTDWNIQTPAFPPIVNSFLGLPGMTLTPANSSSAGSTSSVFRLSSGSVNTPAFSFEIDPLAPTITPFNQRGLIFPLIVAHYASGPTALSSNGFGASAPAIIGVLSIPEPQTYAMLSLGLLALVLVRRRTAR